jgi:NAD(P)-dependent dehydrogenase (short-subunit alcohol dehydrogenase family)
MPKSKRPRTGNKKRRQIAKAPAEIARKMERAQVLAKKVMPLGIRVTIVEPGGFRTDFAAASLTISK